MEAGNYITRLTIDLLSKNVEARDNMMLTVQYIHDFEMAIFKVKKADYYDACFTGKLSSIKTLDRIWRKVQEEKPELRGAEWVERQVQAGRVSASIIATNQLGLW